MKRILAIATIAIRNAVRSRIVILLLGILLLVIIGLPLTIKGDGTVSGYVQVLLGYTLGFAQVLLSFATLWAGCAAVSLEIQDRQIQLVAVKPIRRAEIWAGKWLGLLVLNAILLGFCGVTTYALLKWTMSKRVVSAEERAKLDEEILTARRPIPPVPVNVDDAARKQLEQARARNALPPDVSAERAYEAIRHSLLMQAYTVPPHGKLKWRFDLPDDFPSDHSLLFRFHFSSSLIGFERIAGTWRIGRASSAERYEQKLESLPLTTQSFRVPGSAVTGRGALEVEFENRHPTSVTVLFPPEDGLVLMAYGRTFEDNFIRALLSMFFGLAFLSALGVTAGSLFSMPVASFFSFCVLLIVGLSRFLQSLGGSEISDLFRPEKASTIAVLWNQLLKLVYEGASAVAGPLQNLSPLDLLSKGQLITLPMLGHDFVFKCVIYGGVLALFSSWVLNRRELALPTP